MIIGIIILTLVLFDPSLFDETPAGMQFYSRKNDFLLCRVHIDLRLSPWLSSLNSESNVLLRRPDHGAMSRFRLDFVPPPMTLQRLKTGAIRDPLGVVVVL